MLVVICPPTPTEPAILREAGQRQAWHLVELTGHQLDYHTKQDLWPGWKAYAHEGRYLSTRTMQVLNWGALTMPDPGALN